MPLTINVGLSRKASENYQSTGVSVNITAELDQSLLAKPDELQQQIDQLYQQAGDALDRQTTNPQPPQPAARRAPANGTGAKGYAATSGGNGHGGNGRGNGTRPTAMTESQSRAINAIAKRLSIDAAAECSEILGYNLATLTVRQASEFIDHLKALQPAGNNGGGR